MREDAIQAVDSARPLDELAQVFAAGRIGVVTDGERTLGLLTPIDLLDYLSRDAA